MGVFEYVSVLTSIIIGLGITVLLHGVGVLIQHPQRAKADWIHLSWVGLVFLTMVQWWWFEFRLEEVVWTSTVYLFVISYSVFAYLRCAVLFPTDIEGYEGYWDYFMSRRRWFFSLSIMTVGIDVFDTLLKGRGYFVSLGLEYPAVSAIQVLLFVLGIRFQSRRLQGTIAVLSLAYQLGWMLRDVGGGG